MTPSKTKSVNLAQVKLWGARIGALHWDGERQLGFFEYDPDFLGSGIQVCPITMPLPAPLPAVGNSQIYSFPNLSRQTFMGLPGMLADCLPDKFGNALIDAWLAQQGRAKHQFSPVERLCYIGSRAMGALEFEPRIDRHKPESNPLQVETLVNLANDVLNQRQALKLTLQSEPDDNPENKHRQRALNQIIQVGTSAGGARAKAVIAWHPETQEVRSGQVDTPAGFEHWLMKFDGISNNRDKELADPQGFGLVEYTYSQLAHNAGINMSQCRLFNENGRSHFMSKRFDRVLNAQGKLEKRHMLTLCGMADMDFNLAGAYGYEQAFEILQTLSMPKAELEELFRRMVFNVVSRNQDDHTKNTAFLMDKRGVWRLSPAYDVTFSYNPEGEWTQSHQMSINGKRDHFERSDFLAVAKRFSIMTSRAQDMIDQAIHACAQWPTLAAENGVADRVIQHIHQCHRLDL